jgi:hypothetical protein
MTREQTSATIERFFKINPKKIEEYNERISLYLWTENKRFDLDWNALMPIVKEIFEDPCAIMAHDDMMWGLTKGKILYVYFHVAMHVIKEQRS